MYLHQFHVESLGHYSYLVGSDQSGTAFVVDPKRDVQDYLDLARARQLRITAIFETHVHNDYVSGARELAAAIGAPIHGSAEAGLQYEYIPVKEGHEFRFGELIVRVLSTPGHTPEHVSYVVADVARTEAPALIFTGGDLLVGSIGRPDLLGPEIGRQLAPQLFESLRSKILLVTESLPDLDEAVHQLIRIGYDDIQGYLAGGIDAWLLAGKPVQHVPHIAVHELRTELGKNGAAPRVLDVRSPSEWDAGHIANAIHISGNELPAHVTDVPRDRTLAVVCGSGYRSSVAASVLQRAGFEQVVNVAGGMTAWQQAHFPTTNEGAN